MKKNTVALISVIVAIIIIAGGLYVISSRSNGEEYTKTNDGLQTITEFNVSDPSKTESFVDGTFFVLEKDNKIHIKLVADIFVEEADTGGASIYIPDGLTITDMLCSINGCTSNDYTAVWETTHADAKYHKFIEVARSLFRPTPEGGGAGMLIVEFDLDKSNIDDAKSLAFLIGVGTDDAGEHTLIGVVSKTIDVPLS